MKHFLLIIALAAAWPVFAQEATFRSNPQHTGVYEAAGVTKFTGVKWQFPTRGQVLSSPAIVGDSLYFGSDGHCLYALHLAARALKQSFTNEGRAPASPTVE